MSRMDMFSAYLYCWGKTPPSLADLTFITRHLEDLGFHSIGFPYHMTLPGVGMFQEFGNKHLLDPLALIPVLAAATKRIKLGVHSLILPLLPPYYWAKTLSTIDVISGGRLIPGMCMGWAPGDFNMVGADHKRRARVTDEQMEVITRLWTQDNVTHQGRFYQLDGVTLDPKPAQKPYPTIWYGGGLPSIPRAAKYSRYILPPPEPVEVIKEQWTPAIRAENKRTGKSLELALMNFVAIVDHDSMIETQVVPQLQKCIRLTVTGVKPQDMAIVGTPQTCAHRLKEFMDAGVSHFLLDFHYRGLGSLDYLRQQVDLFVQKVAPLL